MFSTFHDTKTPASTTNDVNMIMATEIPSTPRWKLILREENNLKFCSNNTWVVFPSALSLRKAKYKANARINWATEPMKDTHFTCCLLRENKATSAVNNGIPKSSNKFINLYFIY